jgi:hypothetical protein
MFEKETTQVVATLKPYFGERPIMEAKGDYTAASWAFRLGLSDGDALMLARTSEHGYTFELIVQPGNMRIEATSAEDFKVKFAGMYKEILARVEAQSRLRQSLGGSLNPWSLMRAAQAAG